MTTRNEAEAERLPLILASSSPRRRELLESLGLSFTIIKPAVDEDQRPDEPALEYVHRLSVEKAFDVSRRLASAGLVLAADTIVLHNHHVLGKPADAAEARRMLRTLRGRMHQVCTAITLLAAPGDSPQEPARPLTRLTTTDVYMRPYSDDEIEAYIASGDPFDKAGGYAIQHPAFAPVARIEGSYTNVVGLPLETLRAALNELGWLRKANRQNG